MRARTAEGSEADEATRKIREDCAAFLRRAEDRGVSCPPMPAGADWINSRPLRLDKELKGKLVLLDFWTSCCVNCHHVLPKLADIEARYGADGSGGVVVVGAHSAKFPFERETGTVAAAVEKFGVQHPVVNDERMDLWNAIGISSWPSLVLVSPRGTLLSLWTGERQERDVDLCLSVALDSYRDEIDHRPLPVAPPRSALLRKSDGPLRYPGKLISAPAGDVLYVADTGNHRVLAVDAVSGAVKKAYGNGEPKLVDGKTAEEASFHSPQGLALDGTRLWVADTENHAVRLIDTLTGAVSTIGGNGAQGFDYGAGSTGKAQRMSSPWDVEFDAVSGTLYVAMTGIHQVWCVDAGGEGGGASSAWKIFSGTGRELEKNSSNAKSAAWAQPSGLSLSDDKRGERVMWVADSESSAVRAIDIAGGGTRTVAGGDGFIAENLFAFGDKDGRGSSAKFQHPLAVCDAGDGWTAFCCDSYNNKIKRVARDGTVTTFAGNGKPGLVDGAGGKAQFWEPGGLAMSADGKTLFVADTNNYAIRQVDVQSGAVSTLKLSASLDGGIIPQQPAVQRLVPNRRRAVFLPISLGPTDKAEVEVALPAKCHFTDGTTSRWQVNRVSAESVAIGKLAGGEMKLDQRAGVARVTLPVDVLKAAADSLAGIEIETVVFYCSDTDSTCRQEADVWQVDMKAGSDGVDLLSHTIGSKRGGSKADPVAAVIAPRPG